MENLHAPWRNSYINDVQKKDAQGVDECVFCLYLKGHDDDQSMILGRFSYNFVVMNKFPYNAGHVLILPLEHHATLQDLSMQARAEMIELVTTSDSIIERVLGCHGSNIGINKGRVSGAGIPSHLHVHVVPRWQGDTNFLPVVANIKQISTDMQIVFKKLQHEFDKLK